MILALLKLLCWLKLFWGIEMLAISMIFFYVRKSGNGIYASLGVLTLAIGINLIINFMALIFGNMTYQGPIIPLILWDLSLLVGTISTVCVCLKVVIATPEDKRTELNDQPGSGTT